MLNVMNRSTLCPRSLFCSVSLEFCVFLMTSLGRSDNKRAPIEPAVLHLWIYTLHFHSRPPPKSKCIQLFSALAGGCFLGHCDI